MLRPDGSHEEATAMHCMRHQLTATRRWCRSWPTKEPTSTFEEEETRQCTAGGISRWPVVNSLQHRLTVSLAQCEAVIRAEGGYTPFNGCSQLFSDKSDSKNHRKRWPVYCF